jgi:hypothetical protein
VNKSMTNASPLWPNPAPSGPFVRTGRTPGYSSGRAGMTTYRLGDTDIIFVVLDGEPLTDIMNRVYALGRITGEHDASKEIEEQKNDLARLEAVKRLE